MEPYNEFISENIQQASKDERINLIEMYDVFKSWFKDAFPGDKIPNRFTFRDVMISIWGPMENRGFYGIKFVETLTKL